METGEEIPEWLTWY